MSARPAGPLPPGCFGKLPAAADFVSHNAGSREALAFADWLREGVALAHGRLAERWGAMFRAAPEHRFVFWRAAPQSLLVGTLSPSADRSGRLFPFCVFLAGPAAAFDGALCALPAACDRFFDEASRIAALRGAPAAPGAPASPQDAAADVAGLAARVEALAALAPGAGAGAGGAASAGAGAAAGAPAAVASRARDLVGGRTIGDLNAALGGGAESGAAHRVAANLMALAPRFAASGQSASGLTLRFPLPAAGPDSLPALTFWLELVERSLGRAEGFPVLFWSRPAGGLRGHLDVSFRTPAAGAFLHLVDPDLRSDALYPLAEEEAPPSRAPDRPGGEALAKLSDPSLALADALDAIPGRGSPRPAN